MNAINAFVGKSTKPKQAELSVVLAASKTLWDQLVADLTAEHGLTPEWNSYSQKAGWSLRLKCRDRNIVYLSPMHGCFRASFALGDRAVKAALASGLPPSIINLIKQARRYAEGTAVRIDVKAPKDLLVVKKLAALKLDRPCALRLAP